METEGNVEVPSVFVVSPEKEIDTKIVTNELLEKILSRSNDVRIDIWTHLMRGSIMKLCTLI